MQDNIHISSGAFEPRCRRMPVVCGCTCKSCELELLCQLTTLHLDSRFSSQRNSMLLSKVLGRGKVRQNNRISYVATCGCLLMDQTRIVYLLHFSH